MFKYIVSDDNKIKGRLYYIKIRYLAGCECIHENIFENRFIHCTEFIRRVADI